MLGRIDRARQTIATSRGALDLDTKAGLRLLPVAVHVNGIPRNLHIRLTSGNGVCSSNIRTPVSDGLAWATPNAALCRRDARRVDIVTEKVSLVSHKYHHLWVCLLRSGRGPIRGSRHSDLGLALDVGGDNHGLITRQDSLAKGHNLSSLVNYLNSTGSIYTVWLVVEGLLRLSFIAIQTAMLDYVLALQVLLGRGMFQLTIDWGY